MRIIVRQPGMGGVVSQPSPPARHSLADQGDDDDDDGTLTSRSSSSSSPPVPAAAANTQPPPPPLGPQTNNTPRGAMDSANGLGKLLPKAISAKRKSRKQKLLHDGDDASRLGPASASTRSVAGARTPPADGDDSSFASYESGDIADA